MKQILEKQTKHLEEIEKTIKAGKVIQLTQTSLQEKADKDLNKDQDQTNDGLEKINKTLEDGFKKENAPRSLNSNVVKLFKEAEKQSKLLKKLSPEQAQKITEKAMRVPQFKQIGERVEGLVKGFKDFFSLKGFLNKTGIVSKDSDGILATAVNKRAARMEFIEDRMKSDYEGKGIGKGSLRAGAIRTTPKLEGESEEDYENRLKEKVRESLANIFNDAEDIMRKMRKNEAEIKRMEESGFTEKQIERTGLYGTRADLAQQLSKRDTRFKLEKEESEEPLTQKTSNKNKSEEPLTQKTPSKSKRGALELVVDNTANEAKSSEAASFSDETQIEAFRMQERQVGLLEKIAENTEYLKNLSGEGMARRATGEDAGEGSGGLGAGIAGAAAGLLTKGKAIGKAVLKGGKAVGKAVLSGGKALGQGIMNAARAPLTGVARFAAPLAAGLSVGEGISDLAEGKRVEELSQIVPEGWSKLNPFSWAMRGGMYAGEKLNKGYGTVSESLGGSGSLGGDVYEGVQRVKGFGAQIGEKTRSAVNRVRDSFGRGTGGTMAAQQMDDEVFKRMQVEGVEFGSKRANEIRDEVRKEILAKDPNAFLMADQEVSSKSSVNEVQKTLGNGSIESSQTMAKGIKSEKSLFGSTMLGALVSKKGIETGGFTGITSEQKSTTTAAGETSSSLATSELLGTRISGGLLSGDTYKVSTGDGTETLVQKDQYMKIQNLATKGDVESQKQAVAVLEDIKKKYAEAKQFEGAYDITKSPEEMVTPMTERAPAGPSLTDRFKSMFAPKTVLPGTTAAEMINAPATSKASTPPPTVVPIKTVAAAAPSVVTPALDASANNVKLADKVSQQKQPIVVSAPTTNIANNRQNIVASTPIRNEEYSMHDYMKRRSFAM